MAALAKKLKSKRPSQTSFPTIHEGAPLESPGASWESNGGGLNGFRPGADKAGRAKSFFAKKKKPPLAPNGTAHADQPGPQKSRLKGIGNALQAATLFKRRGAGPELERAQSGSLASEHSGDSVPGAAPPAEGGVAALLSSIEQGTFDLSDRLSRNGDIDSMQDLREALLAGKRQASERIRWLLHADYPAFIAASKAVRGMDGQMQALRAVVQRQQSVLAAVKVVADPEGTSAGLQAAEGGERAWARPWQDSPEGVRWRDALEKLDVAIVERRASDALHLLKSAEKSLLQSARSQGFSGTLMRQLSSGSLGGGQYTERQQQDLASRRQQLNELVTGQVRAAPLGSASMRTATQVLASLSGRAHALQRLLEAHGARIRRTVDQLLKPQNTGGDADGTEFANALGQEVFGAIAAAAEDVTGVFGSELRELASVFLVWALSETEKCALTLKRNALSPFAEPAGLGPTVACCLLPLLHCCGLQASHGLRLAPRLLRDLWPSCDQVLQRRVKRICEDVRGAVAAEVAALLQGGLRGPGPGSGGWAELMQLFPSSDLLLDELEAVVKILAPLGGPRVRQALSAAFTRAFTEYTGALAARFAHHRDEDGRLPPELDAAVEPALEVAHAMVEQFLPEVAEPLLGRCGNVCDARRLQAQLAAFEDSLVGGAEDGEGRWSGEDSQPLTPSASRGGSLQNGHAAANGQNGHAANGQNGHHAAPPAPAPAPVKTVPASPRPTKAAPVREQNGDAGAESAETRAWREVAGFLAVGTDDEVGVALALMRAYNLEPGPALRALADAEEGEDGPEWSPEDVAEALAEARERGGNRLVL